MVLGGQNSHRVGCGAEKPRGSVRGFFTFALVAIRQRKRINTCACTGH